MTDFGVLGQSLNQVGQFGVSAMGNTSAIFEDALQFLNLQSAKNSVEASRTINFAEKTSANALSNSAEVLGFADVQINKARAQAKEAGESPVNKMMMFLGAALVGVLFLKKA